MRTSSDPRLSSGQQVAVVTPLVAEVGHAEVVVDPSVAEVGPAEVVWNPSVAMVGRAEVVVDPSAAVVGRVVVDHLVVVAGLVAERRLNDPQAEVSQQEAMSLQSSRRCQRRRHAGAVFQGSRQCQRRRPAGAIPVTLKTSFL